MDETLHYDGSFNGFLNTIGICLELGSENIPLVKAGNDHEPDLFAIEKKIASDQKNAESVWNKLGQNIPHTVMRRIVHAHLHQKPDCTALIEYIFLAIKLGAAVDRYHADPAVHRVHQQVHELQHEAHRLKGLLRFRKMYDGSFYAPLTPDHQVLPLIAQHFRKRLHNESWLIHDLNRGMALAWDKCEIREAIIQTSELDKCHGRHIGSKHYSEDEIFCQELWRTFHRNLAISGRENHKLQRQFMPRRYWTWLVEEPGTPSPLNQLPKMEKETPVSRYRLGLIPTTRLNIREN